MKPWEQYVAYVLINKYRYIDISSMQGQGYGV